MCLASAPAASSWRRGARSLTVPCVYFAVASHAMFDTLERGLAESSHGRLSTAIGPFSTELSPPTFGTARSESGLSPHIPTAGGAAWASADVAPLHPANVRSPASQPATPILNGTERPRSEQPESSDAAHRHAPAAHPTPPSSVAQPAHLGATRTARGEVGASPPPGSSRNARARPLSPQAALPRSEQKVAAVTATGHVHRAEVQTRRAAQSVANPHTPLMRSQQQESSPSTPAAHQRVANANMHEAVVSADGASTPIVTGGVDESIDPQSDAEADDTASSVTDARDEALEILVSRLRRVAELFRVNSTKEQPDGDFTETPTRKSSSLLESVSVEQERKVQALLDMVDGDARPTPQDIMLMAYDIVQGITSIIPEDYPYACHCGDDGMCMYDSSGSKCPARKGTRGSAPHCASLSLTSLFAVLPIHAWWWAVGGK
mmetsp:Transcript_70097/g.194901  ORF Transcript_70097/g.194901 Transcript_70097/m.194901 type:complete len:435 (+) Transcript_70097:82-1386(+)